MLFRVRLFRYSPTCSPRYSPTCSGRLFRVCLIRVRLFRIRFRVRREKSFDLTRNPKISSFAYTMLNCFPWKISIPLYWICRLHILLFFIYDFKLYCYFIIYIFSKWAAFLEKESLFSHVCKQTDNKFTNIMTFVLYLISTTSLKYLRFEFRVILHLIFCF